MLNFTTSANHGHAITFPDVEYGDLELLTSYTMLFGLRPRVAGWTTTRDIFSKLAGNAGFTLRTINSAGNNRLRMVHGDGASQANPGDSTTNLVSETTYIVILWWDGTIFRYYVNGVSEGDLAFTQGVDANAADVVIGNGNGLSTGAQVALGPVIVWRNYAFTDAEIEQGSTGHSLPVPGYARFFHRGLLIPGIDEMLRIDGTTAGTPLLLSNPAVDTMFALREVEDERMLATQLLVERAADEFVYRVKVPLHLGESMELMDDFNISHDALLRSATHLNAIGTSDSNQLFDNWRRGTYTLVGRSLDVSRREVELTLVERELAIATFLSMDREPFGTADDYPGVARMDVGGVLGESRISTAFIVQENNLLGAISEGNFFALVSPHVSKINHIGGLCEDSTTNGIVNPFFVTQLTSWTTATAGGGSVVAVNDHKALPRDITIYSIQVIGAAAAENSFRQTVAVLTADAFRRLMFTWSDDQDTPPNWRIQRSSDNFYWDNVTGTWVVGVTWNDTGAASYDAVNGQPIISNYWSKPIPVAANENWEIRLGKLNAATTHYFYIVNLTIGKFRFMPLIDTAASAADGRSTVLEIAPPIFDIDNPSSDGLVAAYLFNEGQGSSGATVADSTGNGHDGIITASAGTPDFWETGFGVHDPAFRLDKSPVEMYLRIPDHADFDFAGDFSIVVGFAARPAELAQYDVLVGKASADFWDDGFTIWTQQPAGVNMGFVTTEYVVDENTDVHPTPYNDADYHQVVCLYCSADVQTRIWVDGELRATTNLTQPRVNNATDVYIGRAGSPTVHRNWSGYVFYAYFYNRCLPAPEIESLAENPYQSFTIDEQRQLIPTGRFTITIDLVAFQDGADLSDNDQQTLFYGQVGDTGFDFYAILYQKLAGQNVRFSFERWRDVASVATLDVRTTKDVSIVFGQSYRITARQVSETDQELGLPLRTMRINVDGSNGVDVVASDLFSDLVPYQEIRIGTPPDGSSWKRAGSYISYVRVQQRVIADEEWESA